MRIGVLTTSFPRFDGDIAGSFVLSSCKALIARGHEIDVLTPEAIEPTSVMESPRLRVTPIPYLRPRSWQRTFYGAGVPDNLQHDPRAWLGLLPFTVNLAATAGRRARRWDAIISHWALPSALCASVRPARCRHLSVLHSADVHALRLLPGRRLLASSIVASADHHWFTSHALRDTFASYLNSTQRDRLFAHSTCAPMGIDTPTPVDARDVLRERLELNAFTALVLGRLVPVKGIEHAIAAIAHTTVQLVIAGNGPELERLRALAAPLGSRVRFVGVITGQRKSEWLTAADVLLVPSIVLPSGRTEGVPTVAIEAMSHGCPVIASDVGGIRELIQHRRNGWLVPARDVSALRDSIQTLARDRGLRATVGAVAETSTLDQHWAHVAARWESILSGAPAWGSTQALGARRTMQVTMRWKP